MPLAGPPCITKPNILKVLASDNGVKLQPKATRGRVVVNSVTAISHRVAIMKSDSHANEYGVADCDSTLTDGLISEIRDRPFHSATRTGLERPWPRPATTNYIVLILASLDASLVVQSSRREFSRIFFYLVYSY